MDELRSRRAKEGRLYADLFARGGLTSGIDAEGGGDAPGPAGGTLFGANPDGQDALGEEEDVPGLSPELEAAFEGFSSLPLPGHPKPIREGER